MGAMVIVRDSSRESGPAFYARCGHIFVDKTIRREMGGPLDSNDDYLWFFAYDSDAIAGFAALNCEHLASKRLVWFDNAYVYPAYRDRGLHGRLADLRLALARELGARAIRGLARPAAYVAFEARGFRLVSQRGMYRTYELRLDDAESL